MWMKLRTVFGYAGSVAVMAIIVALALDWNARGAIKEPTINFTSIILQNGYSSEEYSVVTEDGYILTIFRVQRGVRCQGDSKTTPVLLIHGLFGCSDSWLDAGLGAGLPYLLADACYDTWVGNVRGNMYARKHKRLDPDIDMEFWEFSADEIAYYDIPATVDYILNETGTKRLNYLGFSLGSNVIFSTISERPEYSNRLGVIIAIGAPINMVNMTSFFKTVLQMSVWLERILNKIGVYEVFAKSSLVQRIAEHYCRYSVVRDTLCKGFMNAMDTPHPGSIADDTYETLYGHFPVGTSIRTMARFGQSVRSGTFQKYDFGEDANLKKYGSSLPPRYNLTSVTVPTVIIQGASDTLVDVRDSEWLASRLPDLEELFIIEDASWNHFDLIYSRNINMSMFPIINYYLLKHNV